MTGAGPDRPLGGRDLAERGLIRGSWSLRAWLVLLVLATTAPLAGYGLYHAISNYFAQRAALIGNTEAVARSVAGLVTQELDRDVLDLQILAATPPLQNGDYAAFIIRARAFLAASDPTGVLSVFDAEGHTLLTTGQIGARRANPEASARVFETDAPIVSDLDPAPGRPLRMSVDVPVMRDGQVVSDLALSLPLTRMQAIVVAERLPRGWASAILDGSGRVIAHSVDADSIVGTSARPAVLRLLASGVPEGTADVKLRDGTWAVAVLERTPRFGWSALVAIPRAQIFAPLRETVTEMATVGALALALSLGFAMLIARRLARPVTALARLAAALDGDEALPAHEPGLREADAVARALQDAVRRRRLAEESAKDAELRAARLIEAVPCGLIGFDVGGNWSFVNRATCDLLARPASALLGLSVRSPDLVVRGVDGSPIPPEDRASARALRGETVRDLEVSMRRGTGGRIALLLSAVPLRDREGRVVGALTAMLDVTQRRAAQDRLDNLLLTLEARVHEEVAAREVAQREAAQAQKMQALGELAGGVAHDFNNVLQALSGAVALINRHAGDPDEVRRFAASASTAAARGAAVASRLLTFARRGELRAAPVEAAGLLRDTAEMLRHTLGAHVTVKTEAADGVGWLMADLAQLQTVLVNLAANARDAMETGGTLTLRAVPETVVGAAHPVGLRPGRYVRLEAADTGTGMDAATLARATEPFFTTKPVDKGTGLGLAMARGFAEQLGGGLAIASLPGRGTTVRLWLPGVDEPIAGAVAPVVPTMPASGGLHVLLVDDEDGGRTLLAEELAELGFVVHEARDAREARALLDVERCDVLVTDFSMPGENGLALIAAARDSHPGLPALLLTGLGADPTLATSSGTASEGITETVGKPVRVADLAARISRLGAAGA